MSELKTKHGYLLLSIGLCLALPGALFLVAGAISLLAQAIKSADLVEYAAYMLNGQGVFMLLVSAALLVPGALLAKQGLNRIRAAEEDIG